MTGERNDGDFGDAEHDSDIAFLVLTSCPVTTT